MNYIKSRQWGPRNPIFYFQISIDDARGYSELFVLLKEVTIEEKGKSKDMEEFVKKMLEMNKVMKMGESFTRSTYARMLLREELTLLFICALFKVARLIFFERLPKLLI